MFVDQTEDLYGNSLTYAHCYEDDDKGNEFGCGMEYELDNETGVLRHWHDAVGLVTETTLSGPHEWDELVAWHDENCVEGGESE